MHKQYVCVCTAYAERRREDDLSVCLSVRGGHLGVLEKSVFLDAFDEHQLVVAVPGPVEQVLHQVLVILENTL